MSDDHDVRFRRLLREVLESPGELPPAVRAQAAAEAPLPEPLASFARKLRAGAPVHGEDVEALRRAGYSEDAVFELTVAVALGLAKRRLDEGLRALQEAVA